MTYCYYQHFLRSANIYLEEAVCIHNQERCNIMAKNRISSKSSKGVQFSEVIHMQPKIGIVKNVDEPKDPECGLKVNPSELKTELTHERIAEQARVIWQNRGCKPGEDERNWSEAETQLKAELGIL
jgi:hypothetical protein